MGNQTSMDAIISLAKRRGFVFPSSEIYGGLSATYDYGPLGVELKNTIRRLWWKRFVEEREDMYGIESSIIMHPKVWEASGHLQNFNDPLVECKECHARFRADHLLEAESARPGYDKQPSRDVSLLSCPNCGGRLSPERQFNLMFKTYMGPVEEAASVVYLRPETAAGMFVDFKQIQDSMHARLPFGIAQSGKAFRNEITTESFIFRTREFEIMEFEYFCSPGDAPQKFEEWLAAMRLFYTELGLKPEHLHLNEKKGKDLAHYSARTIDLEYDFPIGQKELWAIANRTDFDLRQHMQYSGRDLHYRNEQTGEKYIPYVIEPTFGLDRTFLAVFCGAYEEVEPRSGSEETKDKHEKEVILHLPKVLAPIQIVVLPLSRKEPLVVLARSIQKTLSRGWRVSYDETASIGKRYRRQDEVGTPFCVTVDFDSVEDKKVTVRDRDTMQQERIYTHELSTYFQEQFPL